MERVNLKSSLIVSNDYSRIFIFPSFLVFLPSQPAVTARPTTQTSCPQLKLRVIYVPLFCHSSARPVKWKKGPQTTSVEDETKKVNVNTQKDIPVETQIDFCEKVLVNLFPQVEIVLLFQVEPK